MSIKESAGIDAAQAATEDCPAAAGAEPATTESNQRIEEVIQLQPGSLAYSVVTKLKALPYDRQRELLDFAEFLESKTLSKQPHRSLMGLFADQGVSLSTEEIDELRRECWSMTPKDPT